MAKFSQNQNCDRRHRNSSLKMRQFQGTRMRKWGKWVSEIRMPNSKVRIWLGSYDTPEKAARAYDFAVYCLKGSKAKLNFPHSPPKIPCASSLSPPQIQAAAAKYSAEEFPLPSGDEFNFPHSLPEIPCASCLSPPQIQAPDAKYSAEEFLLPSEEDAAFSISGSEEECGTDGKEISAEQGPAIGDPVLEDLDNGVSLTLEEFPPFDVPLEDFGVLFQLTENCGHEDS